jgi:predicted GH43/DUF377 family glycosyl hydrolase
MNYLHLLRPVRLVPLAWLVACSLGRAQAQVSPWVKDPASPVLTSDGGNFHPFGAIGDPFVMWDSGVYKMWFTGLAVKGGKEVLGTAYSESVDGLVWSDTKSTTELISLVLEPDPGGWDQFGVETANVVRRPSDGKYMLYYTGNAMGAPHSYAHIGLALSDDGIHWTKHPGPVLTDTLAWEQPFTIGGVTTGGVLEPTVLVEGGVFKMWYVSFGIYQGGWTAVGYATSPDGISWSKQATPVMLPGPAGDWDDAYASHVHVLADPLGGYHMFYAGGESATGETMRIGYAHSDDGLTWIKSPLDPVVEGSAGTWDAGMTGGPSALIVGNELRLYYMGSTLPSFVAPLHFGIATAPADFHALLGSPSSISIATGGTQSLSLRAGTLHAGELYLVLGSASGTQPGIAVNGLNLPLNQDAWFTATLLGPNLGALVGTFGLLDATGRASAALVVPAGGLDPALAGLEVVHAFVALDFTTGAVDFASNAWPLTLTP